MKAMMEKYMKCPECQDSIVATFPTHCIATGIRVSCSNDMCNFVDVQKPQLSDVPLPPDAGSALVERNSDYALNILYVIAFMSSGDGGTEAGCLLGHLDLPNCTTFAKRSFTSIEEQIRPTLRKIGEELIYKNLCSEVWAVLGDKKDSINTGKLHYDLWKEGALPEAQWPCIKASTEMGWQGRSSGNLYTSKSGHALFVGGTTRKPITWFLLSLHCSFCKGWHRSKNKEQPVPHHQCCKNWDGSSGAMEPASVLKMYKDLWNNHCDITKTIITDDDSSIKTKLKYSNAGLQNQV